MPKGILIILSNLGTRSLIACFCIWFSWLRVFYFSLKMTWPYW